MLWSNGFAANFLETILSSLTSSQHPKNSILVITSPTDLEQEGDLMFISALETVRPVVGSFVADGSLKDSFAPLVCGPVFIVSPSRAFYRALSHKSLFSSFGHSVQYFSYLKYSLSAWGVQIQTGGGWVPEARSTRLRLFNLVFRSSTLLDPFRGVFVPLTMLLVPLFVLFLDPQSPNWKACETFIALYINALKSFRGW